MWSRNNKIMQRYVLKTTLCFLGILLSSLFTVFLDQQLKTPFFWTFFVGLIVNLSFSIAFLSQIKRFYTLFEKSAGTKENIKRMSILSKVYNFLSYLVLNICNLFLLVIGISFTVVVFSTTLIYVIFN